MRSSIRYTTLLLSMALLSPAWAQLGFNGLNRATSTGDGSSSGTAVLEHETDRERGRRLLVRSGELLERCLENYRQLVESAEEQSDRGRNKYFYSQKSAYQAAGRLADSLSADLLEAQGALDTSESLIGPMEKSGEPAWALELRLEWTRQVTLFNQLRFWCERRVLRYDTWAFRDQQTRYVLTTRDKLEAFRLPRSTGVRKETNMPRSVAEPMANLYITSASQAVEKARAAHRVIFEQRKRPGEGEEEHSRYGWTIYRYSTVSLFDRVVRPRAVEFSIAMLRAKANLNAAVLATEAPSQGFSEKNHTDIRLLMIRYAMEVQWGDDTFLEVPGTFGAKRKQWIFDGSGFHGQYRIDTGGLESKHLEDVLKYAARNVNQ